MERKIAAAFVSGIYTEMVRQTLEGMIESARESGAKLLFFTSFADNFSSRQYDRYRDYDAGDFVVYLLPNLEDFDALVSFDTYMPIIYIEWMDQLKRKAACPVITLGAVKEGRCSVVNAQGTALAALIEHLIDRHGCRDIVHVAGQPDLTFVQERIAIFRDTMARRGLPCGDDRIFHGDLSPDCGEAVAAQILESRAGAERPLPEAIVCANDYMAIGLINALKARGFAVPGDVLVTGYDDVLPAQFNEPSITTSAQPFTEVGRTGMEALSRLWRGEAVEKVIAVPGRLVCRQSCGCEPIDAPQRDLIREHYAAEVANQEAFALSNTDLILGASTGSTLEALFDEIEAGCLRETGFSDAVLCLIDGWEKHPVIEHYWNLRDARFDVACGIYHGKPIRRERLAQGQLLPAEMMADDEPYFIFPVHHLQYFMGYFIVSPRLREIGQLHVKSWLVSISTVLENWCIRSQLKDTVDKLDHLYQTDTLTGLYNRRGYQHYFEAYYEDCRAGRKPLAVFMIDMNRMKAINDRYGHAEGDYCLCAIAEAVRACARGDEICVRAGGDEFVVLARGCDEVAAQAYIRDLHEAIRRICARDGKAYSFTVSIGLCVRVPDPDSPEPAEAQAEDYLRFADKAMYAEKKRMEA